MRQENYNTHWNSRRNFCKVILDNICYIAGIFYTIDLWKLYMQEVNVTFSLSDLFDTFKEER